MTLGDRIRNARLRAGLTQMELGMRAGYSPAYAPLAVNRIERGRVDPRASTLLPILVELELLSVEWGECPGKDRP